MPTTIPAMRGQFGETEYWITTMSIGELIRNIRFPQDLDGWKDMSVEEKFQREINVRRVRDSIAPYFASDPDRFSGALVLAVMNNEDMLFEPLDQIGGARTGFPQLYKSAARDIGFLTLQGPEIFVPLDGQHRAKAFMYAIDGVDDNNRPIPNMRANQELGKDLVTLILIRWEPTKARRIFNKINRNAKPTTKADNLITDDDDAVAVMTREFIRSSEEGGIVSAGLVNHKSNTLNSAAREFTTLSTLYEATHEIILGLGIAGKGKPSDMNEEQREVVTPDVREIWGHILGKVDLFAKALEDPSENGDGTRKQIREDTLLGKPIGQLSLVRGYMLMRERCIGVDEDELCRRLNHIDWSVNNPMWEGVLMNPNGRVMSGRGTVNRALEFIAHLAGAELAQEETERLLEHIHGSDWEEHELPSPVA